MIADLKINAAQGMQIFEATDLMLRRRKLDSSSHVMILQVSALGDLFYSYNGFNHRHLGSLREYLLETYPEDFMVSAYFASQYPSVPPRITEIALTSLTLERVKSISTLHIPQYRSAPLHLDMIQKYELEGPLFDGKRLVPINASLDELD